MRHIHYKSGYKYVLQKDYSVHVEIFGEEIDTPFVKLDESGKLTIKANFAWDGPSGPAIDTKTFMRASLVHDAIYGLIRDGYLTKADRLYADQLLREMCVEDGMSSIRAWWVYVAVRSFAARAVDGNSSRKVQEAP